LIPISKLIEGINKNIELNEKRKINKTKMINEQKKRYSKREETYCESIDELPLVEYGSRVLFEDRSFLYRYSTVYSIDPRMSFT
jgi:hypothetical protein